MARYIDADVLKERLENLKAEIDNEKYFQWHIAAYFSQIIDDAPTADVEPVRHGRWIHNGLMLNRQKCPECGFWDDALQADYYCPNCGAKMDGDEK